MKKNSILKIVLVCFVLLFLTSVVKSVSLYDYYNSSTDAINTGNGCGGECPSTSKEPHPEILDGVDSDSCPYYFCDCAWTSSCTETSGNTITISLNGSVLFPENYFNMSVGSCEYYSWKEYYVEFWDGLSWLEAGHKANAETDCVVYAGGDTQLIEHGSFTANLFRFRVIDVNGSSSNVFIREILQSGGAVNLSLSNNTIPSFNITHNNTIACINDTNDKANFYFNISASDLEGDTIYYSLDILYFDESPYFTDFGSDSSLCENLNILTDFNNNFGGFANFSNTDLNAIKIRSYDQERKCVLEIKNETWANSIYDKSLVYRILDTKSLDYDLYLKINLPINNSYHNMYFSDFNDNLLLNLTFNRLNNYTNISQNNTVIYQYNDTDFFNLYFSLNSSNDNIKLNICTNDDCTIYSNILSLTEDFTLFKDIYFNIQKGTLLIDDFIISRTKVPTYSTTKPTYLNYSSFGSFPSRICVIDYPHMSLPFNASNCEIFYSSVVSCDSPINSVGLTDVTGNALASLKTSTTSICSSLDSTTNINFSFCSVLFVGYMIFCLVIGLIFWGMFFSFRAGIFATTISGILGNFFLPIPTWATVLMCFVCVISFSGFIVKLIHGESGGGHPNV